MKTYIKPNTEIIEVKLQGQLMSISGGDDEKRGSSNGDYTSGVTLGSRGDLWDDED